MSSKTDPRSITLRAFGLLEAVAATAEPVGLLDLARISRLPKPSAHRIAQMLEQSDLIARAPQGGYEPGAALRKLALAVVTRGAATDGARAVLRALVDETGESCALTVLEGGDVLVLEHAESIWPLRLALEPGSRLPAHCTAAGKVLLACLSPSRRERILTSSGARRFTPNTLTDRAALASAIEAVRASGIANDREEYLAGLVAVAVPVGRAGADGPIAALTLFAPSARKDVAGLTAARPALESAAARLATLLAG